MKKRNNQCDQTLKALKESPCKKINTKGLFNEYFKQELRHIAKETLISTIPPYKLKESLEKLNEIQQITPTEERLTVTERIEQEIVEREIPSVILLLDEMVEDHMKRRKRLQKYFNFLYWDNESGWTEKSLKNRKWQRKKR